MKSRRFQLSLFGLMDHILMFSIIKDFFVGCLSRYVWKDMWLLSRLWSISRVLTTTTEVFQRTLSTTAKRTIVASPIFYGYHTPKEAWGHSLNGDWSCPTTLAAGRGKSEENEGYLGPRSKRKARPLLCQSTTGQAPSSGSLSHFYSIGMYDVQPSGISIHNKS